jgi:hypothetical protein
MSWTTTHKKHIYLLNINMVKAWKNETLNLVGLGSNFRRNFTNFVNFGGGRKKNPKFHYILIHVLYNLRIIVYIVYSSIYSIDV